MLSKNLYWQALSYLAGVFLMILIPTYLSYYGPQNFLWLSDIGLFLTCLALWFNSALFMSMAAVGVMALELIWCVGFFSELIFNFHVITLADYMFNPAYPLALRAISLFHIVTPVIWFFFLRQFGYEQKAIYYFIVLYWCDLILAYIFTNPSENINWVFMPELLGLKSVGPTGWLIILAFGFPILFFLPTHLIYKKYFKVIN
jgi:hypothetical protein